jgi:predicted MFS family arabinose efflux permease
MWELYAMWAWVPLFLLASFQVRDIDPSWASAAAFAVIAVGRVGSVVAGYVADRIGRTTVTIASMVISGSCVLVVGILFGGSPIVLVFVCLIWGFAFLSIGPALGVWAMSTLRRMPAAERLAGGRG